MARHHENQNMGYSRKCIWKLLIKVSLVFIIINIILLGLPLKSPDIEGKAKTPEGPVYPKYVHNNKLINKGENHDEIKHGVNHENKQKLLKHGESHDEIKHEENHEKELNDGIKHEVNEIELKTVKNGVNDEKENEIVKNGINHEKQHKQVKNEINHKMEYKLVKNRVKHKKKQKPVKNEVTDEKEHEIVKRGVNHKNKQRTVKNDVNHEMEEKIVKNEVNHEMKNKEVKNEIKHEMEHKSVKNTETHERKQVKNEVIHDVEHIKRIFTPKINKEIHKTEVFIYNSTTHFDHVPSKYLPRGISETDDRIAAQLEATVNPPIKNKIILQYYPMEFENGEGYFKRHCRVKSCVMTEDRSLLSNDSIQVDGLIFQTNAEFVDLPKKKANQIWMLFMLESPCHTTGTEIFKDKINWTMTYRMDSTIVTPYFKYLPFSLQKGSIKGQRLPTKVNYAEGKTKLIAWFVTNCRSHSGRLDYVRELKKYVHVDVYGSCGNLRCDRFRKTQECEDMLEKDYKFYLGFENSKCKDYITEKPHIHGLV